MVIPAGLFPSPPMACVAIPQNNRAMDLCMKLFELGTIFKDEASEIHASYRATSCAPANEVASPKKDQSIPRANFDVAPRNQQSLWGCAACQPKPANSTQVST